MTGSVTLSAYWVGLAIGITTGLIIVGVTSGRLTGWWRVRRDRKNAERDLEEAMQRHRDDLLAEIVSVARKVVDHTSNTEKLVRMVVEYQRRTDVAQARRREQDGAAF